MSNGIGRWWVVPGEQTIWDDDPYGDDDELLLCYGTYSPNDDGEEEEYGLTRDDARRAANDWRSLNYRVALRWHQVMSDHGNGVCVAPLCQLQSRNIDPEGYFKIAWMDGEPGQRLGPVHPACMQVMLVDWWGRMSRENAHILEDSDASASWLSLDPRRGDPWTELYGGADWPSDPWAE